MPDPDRDPKDIDETVDRICEVFIKYVRFRVPGNYVFIIVDDLREAITGHVMDFVDQEYANMPRPNTSLRQYPPPPFKENES